MAPPGAKQGCSLDPAWNLRAAGGGKSRAARENPGARADERAEGLAHAKLVQPKLHLPVARRAWIAAHGAFRAVDGPDDSRVRRFANGPLSIDGEAGYTRIGPERRRPLAPFGVPLPMICGMSSGEAL